MDTDIVFVFDV